MADPRVEACQVEAQLAFDGRPQPRTQLGALETAPVLIAVITAFLAMEGVKYVVTGRRRAEPAAAIPAARDLYCCAHIRS